MLFNSLNFLIFFPVVTTTYFLLPYRFRWALLLASSCIFYMSFVPKYILILAFTITIDYFAALLIESLHGRLKRVFFIASLVSNIGVLFVFKYFNFFNSNLAYLAEALHWNYSISSLEILLPVGLSFHTFQSMSYIIEVFRGRQKAEKNYGIFALYVMFYPQLVAGPIERPQNLLHQFYERHDFDYKRVTEGLRLMAWGMFKKVAVADRLASFVNNIYGAPYDFHGWPLILATVFFAFQIYCDFSGYSDIAVGAAKVMGFRLMNNFDQPYWSRSISEFWRRWHISLSSWFRDYLYLPLGGNRVSHWRWALNILVVFLISGLWHGANWVFLMWGLLHAVYLIVEVIVVPKLQVQIQKRRMAGYFAINDFSRRIAVFALVCLGWIFFRASNIHEAFYIVSNLFKALGDFSTILSFGVRELASCVLVIVIMGAVEYLSKKASIRRAFVCQWPFRWAAYYSLILMMIALGLYNNSKFVYFQF